MMGDDAISVTTNTVEMSRGTLHRCIFSIIRFYPMVMFNPSSPCYNSLEAANSAISEPESVEIKLTLCFPMNPRFSRIAPRIEST